MKRLCNRPRQNNQIVGLIRCVPTACVKEVGDGEQSVLLIPPVPPFVVNNYREGKPGTSVQGYDVLYQILHTIINLTYIFFYLVEQKLF